MLFEATFLLAYGCGDRVWRALNAFPRRPVILTYHRVQADGEPPAAAVQGPIRAAELEKQVAHLLRTHAPTQLADLLAGAPRRKPGFAVTFDDGYRDTYTVAFPIMERLGVPATLFPATDPPCGRGWLWWDRIVRAVAGGRGRKINVGGREVKLETAADVAAAQTFATAATKRCPRPNDVAADIERQLGVDAPSGDGLYLSWKEINDLRRAGWNIGAHTRSHRVLTSLAPDEARAEIIGSADDVASAVGERPRLFAYPNGRPGDFDERIIAWLQEEGFVCAATMVGGPVDARPDPFRLRRVAPAGAEPWAKFLLRVSGLYYHIKGA